MGATEIKNRVVEYLQAIGHGLPEREFIYMFGKPDVTRQALAELVDEGIIAYKDANMTYYLVR